MKNKDLEGQRGEMFLVAIVLILSALYCTLAWVVPRSDDSSTTALEEIIEDIDFERLKKDLDMVPAIVPPTVVSPVVPVIVAVDDTPDEEEVVPAAEEAAGSDDDDSPAATVPDNIFVTRLNDNESLVVMEQMPQFPGGAGAFMQWLTANIKYPPTARDRKIEGKVVVSFIVDSNGETHSLHVDESSSTLLSNTVLAALRNMPAWQPGVKNGAPQATMIKIPINFEL